MKIVCVDNFNREGPGNDDRLVADKIEHQDEANAMCSALNRKWSGSTSTAFFRVVPDDYVLQVFEP